jgi:putative transposase
VLLHYRDDLKYLVHEFVVMPDHFHILITLDSNVTVERALQLIKGGFAFRAGRELGFHPPVWQKGFSEVRVLNREAYDAYCAYIHENPVARGLVSKAADFQSGSASKRVPLDPPPLGLKPFVHSTQVDTAEAVS